MKRRCVFLDRDGVINVKPASGHYVRSWAEFQFLPTIADWIRLFNVLDFLVVVVSNQRGVARGMVDLETLQEIHRNMVEELARLGARIDDVLFCPHEEGTCNCRKPAPGLVLMAQQKWNIDVAGSLLIGDSERDRLLAAACGLRFLQVEAGRIVDFVPVVEELQKAGGTTGDRCRD